MKESVTKFDLEAAFKALDELDTPSVTSGVKANKPALTEIFSRKSKFDALMEEYYDVGNTAELADAQEAREAEVAKAKLARIEKIVDLDADSPEDLLTSYVGKYIMQCPQCMTLFYKSKEDIEESEDDPSTVNVNEVCQHCGNDSGYTLIGKVGEADSDEDEENSLELNSEDEELDLELEETGEESENSDEETGDETGDFEDFDLDGELEALPLDDESDGESEKTEEAHFIAHEGEALFEELQEDTDFDVSADEFENLIKSPEFQKPITPAEAKAMLNELGENCNADKDPDNGLEEGIFDKVKDKVAGAVDKITSTLKSREAKADWVLANAMEDYEKAEFDKLGRASTSDDNKKYKNFIVLCFTNKYSNGKKITSEPSYDNTDLLIGNKPPQIKDSFKDAENIAKGWSQIEGNGPAYVYLAKSVDDEDAIFLCKYFEGNLCKDDQVEKMFETVKNNLSGVKSMNKGGVQSATEQVKVSDIKQGMVVKLDETTTAEVIEVGQSKFKKAVNIKFKFEDGSTESHNIGPNETLDVYVDGTKQEALKNNILDDLMAGLNSLQEEALESLISTSLVESYGNVAGFRLKDCSYIDEKLTVSGNVHFASGNTRNITYTFTEAFKVSSEQIKLHGFNEKLGKNKLFTITGHSKNGTLITESFKCTNIK